MSFNVSRFLVRVRRFWTRNRLVPVLGISALFLFGMTSYYSISSLFNKTPMIARYFVIEGDAQSQEVFDEEADTHVFRFKLDHRDRHERWRHRHEHDGERMLWQHQQELQERAQALREEARRLREIERERIELENRFLDSNPGSEDDDDDRVIIMKRDDGETFEVTINGEKIEIVKSREEI